MTRVSIVMPTWAPAARRRCWHLARLPHVVAHHYPSNIRNRAYHESEGARNWLWTTWLRRSPRRALEVTGQIVSRRLTDADMRRVLLEALGSLPRIVRHRARISPVLEAQLECLETTGAKEKKAH